MTQRLGLSTALLLTVPPLMWAGNAVVGRLVRDDIPPFTLNFLRWGVAFAILLPLAAWVLRRSGGMWSHWKRFAVLGLFGVGLYNTLQYLALQTSTALNVTLVASSMPLWMLALGAVFFNSRISRQQLVGAALSMTGVAVVLTRGDWHALLALRLVVGDVFMLAATFCWALYSWLLTRRAEPDTIRNDWAAFLLAQVTLGLMWSGMFTAGEWALTDAHIRWSGGLLAALVFVAVGPAVLAYRCWGLGVQKAGPAVAGFFTNLTPLFAAVMSGAFLGEMPQAYHGLAFVLIVAGIVASSRR
jgi:drug/metabolite transporter (DMT)-like permease